MSLFLQIEPEKGTNKTGQKTKRKSEETSNDDLDKAEPECPLDKTIVRKMLGRFNEDREYFETLLKEESSDADRTGTNKRIHNKACDGLEYLYSRAEFWNQKEPVQLPKTTNNKSKVVQHTTDKIVNDGEEKQLENTEFEAETHVRNTDKELGIESEIKSSRFDNRNKVSYTKNNIKTTNVGNKSERKTIENRTKDNSVKTTKNNETYRREPHPKHVNNVRQQNGNKINCNENTSKNESGIADARKETQKRTHEPVRHQLRPTDLEVKNDNDSGRVEPECTIDKPTVRKVLGKLNDDVEYFKKLLNEKGPIAGTDETGKRINDKAFVGLEYLYSRAVFWSKLEPEQLRSWKWNNSKRHPAKLNGHASKILARTQADKLSERNIVRKHVSSTQLGKDNQFKNMKTESKLKDKSQPVCLENSNRNTINVEVPKPEAYIEQMNNEDLHENMTNKDVLTSNTAIETQLETTDTKSQFEHGDDETHSVSTNKSENTVGGNEDETHDTNTTHLENKEKHYDDGGSDLENTDNEFGNDDTANQTRLESPNNDDNLENANKTISAQLVKDIQQKLEEIENDMSDGNYQQSLESAQETLTLAESYSDEDIPNRPELLAQLHGKLGAAHLQIGNTEQALEHHKDALELVNSHGLEETRSSTLDNLGKAYVENGEFEQALQVWQDKVPLTKTPVERAWVLHEMGWCAFELGKFLDARDCGEWSIQAAEEAENTHWQLHASVLLAQSQAHLNDYKQAKETFEKALKLAKGQGNTDIEEALHQTLTEIEKKSTSRQDNLTNEIEETDTVSIIDEVPYEARGTTSSANMEY